MRLVIQLGIDSAKRNRVIAFACLLGIASLSGCQIPRTQPQNGPASAYPPVGAGQGSGAIGTGVAASQAIMQQPLGPAQAASPQMQLGSPALPGGLAGSHAAPSNIATVSYEESGGVHPSVNGAIHRQPYLPRNDMPGIPGAYGQQDAGFPAYQWRHPNGDPEPWNKDEYLFDGGDRNVEAAIDRDWSIYGLDMEDTVAHYDTLAGARIVEASNRVQIYAPRFGSVRKTYGLLQDQAYDHMGQTDQTSLIVSADDTRGSVLTHQNLQPLGQNGRRNTSEFLDEQRGLTVDNPKPVSTMSNVAAAYEDMALIRFGRVENSEKARLAEGIQAAETWQHELPVQVVVDAVQVVVSRGVDVVQEEAGLDLQDPQPQMRVVKIAATEDGEPSDRINAKSGDIVEFMIRFDNIGNERVGNVTLLDNLTPRLEYIDGSTVCDIEDIQPILTENEGGSMLLRWEITDPLAPGEGGVIRFQCRVR